MSEDETPARATRLPRRPAPAPLAGAHGLPHPHVGDRRGSFVTGMVFLLMGAWPIFGFFGLDVALVYVAFRLNYRSGRLYELIELTPESLTVTRVHPSGKRESFDFNPYWVRVRLAEDRQGRTDMRLASHGKEVSIRPLPHRR